MVSPFLVLWMGNRFKNLQHLVDPIIAIIYFGYSGLYMVTVSYSYYTAFIQFFFGLVLFFRFSTRSFLVSYISGYLIFNYSVGLLENVLPASEYEARVTDMGGAILPVFLISILTYFLIKKSQNKAEASAVFFQRVGESMGFLLHEIKGPLQALGASAATVEYEEIEELIHVSNVMWPSSGGVEIEKVEFSLKELALKVVSRFEDQINHFEIEIDFEGEFSNVNTSRQITRLICKNLIKNAVEEIIEHNPKKKRVIIKMPSQNELNISNYVERKLDSKKIFTIGFSSKTNQTNKGLGLFICRELGSKAGMKLGCSQGRGLINFQLKFT